jgi:hypothetical protein
MACTLAIALLASPYVDDGRTSTEILRHRPSGELGQYRGSLSSAPALHPDGTARLPSSPSGEGNLRHHQPPAKPRPHRRAHRPGTVCAGTRR